MTFFDNLQSRIEKLDKNNWYKYLAITAAIFFLVIGLILFFYYSAATKWQSRIDDINESRQEVKRLLDRAERVQKERSEVTKLLEEDPNFKIKAYIQDILEKIGIFQNINAAQDVTVTTTQDGYKENVATYLIAGISMRQLTEFLDELDNNKRIFTKELDITKSKKVPRAIDVDIKIATMMPKET